MHPKVNETKNRRKTNLYNITLFFKNVGWYISLIRESNQHDAAINSSTSPEVLTKLAKNENLWVRCDIASNPSTPPEVLAKLAKDEILYVRAQVAYNPTTQPEVLTRLAGDIEWVIRETVAQNLSTPPETLIRLYSDTNSTVQVRVIQNPSFFKSLQTKAEQEGICEAGQQIPVEWLKQLYLMQ